MNERHLRVLILTLQRLDLASLKKIWDCHWWLHKYFVGISIEIEERPLTILSEDFFKAIFSLPTCLESAETLALNLMKRDQIDYASHVVRQLGINDPLLLAEIVMSNGRIAALDAMPQREQILERIRFPPRGQLFISYVSSELHVINDIWNVWLHQDLVRSVQELVRAVEIMVYSENTVMLEWIAKNLDDFMNFNKDLLTIELRKYRNQLKRVRRRADVWKFAPANAIVQILLANTE